MFPELLPFTKGLGKASDMHLLSLVADPLARAALAKLVLLDIALGIDNLIFIAILSTLDLVDSIGSILTTGSMHDEIETLIAAMVFASGLILLAADPLGKFIKRNPTLVMLALAFLMMMAVVQMTDAFRVHILKNCIYAAVGFSVIVGLLDVLGRNRRARRKSA